MLVYQLWDENVRGLADVVATELRYVIWAMVGDSYREFYSLGAQIQRAETPLFLRWFIIFLQKCLSILP